MATIRFRVLGKGDNASIYIRLSMGRKGEIVRKTGLTINAKDWSAAKSMPNPKDDYLKNLQTDLLSMANKLQVMLNDATKQGLMIDGDWLNQQIDLINNKVPLVELDIVTNYVQHIINTAAQRPNSKQGLGLSERRVKGYITFKGVVERFENEIRKGKKLMIRDVDLNLAEQFKSWLFSKNYSVNYSGKNIDNLKAVCNDASKNGYNTSPTLSSIKSFNERKAPEAIIFLSEDELEQIESTVFENDALKNAKKWLLLGCQLGQRGGDLLSITEDKIRQLKGIRVIELIQQKTGKSIAIPLLPKAESVIEDGFPYPIALQNFNEYIKVVCKDAKINKLTEGRKRLPYKGNKKGIQPSVKGTYQKHELIGSHVCRRSWATNYYGKIPTPVLINITGHGTEKMFLKYIGKTAYDNAYQMAEYFNKLTSSKDQEVKLKLVKTS